MRWTSLILVQSQTLKVMKLTYKQKYLKFLIVTLSHEKHSIYQSGKLLNPWVLIKDSISISFLKRISASRAKIKRRVSWWIHTSLWRTSPFTKNPTIRSITIKRSYLQKSTKKLLAEMERKPYLIPNKKTTKHQPLIGRASWNQKACSEKGRKNFLSADHLRNKKAREGSRIGDRNFLLKPWWSSMIWMIRWTLFQRSLKMQCKKPANLSNSWKDLKSSSRYRCR